MSHDANGTPGASRTMMALRAHERGGPEKLVYETAPRPVPGSGEVLITVHAAAITFAELSWDPSWTTLDGRDRTPVIPSHEVAGTVAELGPSVTGVAVGDPVYGLIDFDRDGAAAEFVTAPARTLARAPASVSYAESAALPLSALTAWQALVDHAHTAEGEEVLVHGGAGGVGVYAVQIAALLGARVTATGRSRDADFVRRLGAARFIDFTSERFDEVASRFDVVLDTVGGDTLERSYGVLAPGGRVVTLGAPPAPDHLARFGTSATFFIVTPDAAQLTHLARLVDEGGLRPVVSRTFALHDGRRAFESGTLPHDPGKTVLIP